MKKTISVILLLALCLSLFAGCKSEAPAADLTNLERAKALVFNKYKPAKKDEVPVKSADFEVMTGVIVENETYPVSWTVEVTAGPADAVKIVDGSSADFKKVDVTERPEVEINFTLTATISDGNGNTATVSFNYKTLKTEAPAASKVVIKLVKDGNYTTGTEYEYTSSSSGKKKIELVLSTNKAEAVAFNMIENDDGTVTFKTDDGYFLFCDATHVKFVNTQDDNTKFVLETAEGGYYIKCAVATYQDKPQYLEVYSGYLTCYGINDSSDLSIYTFALEEATGAAGTVSSLGDSTAPTDPAPTVDNSNDPAADSALSIADAIALGASKAHNTYTDNKYYVTGEITEVYSEQYGNMKIKDAQGNILTVYGTYDADGTNRYDAMSVKPVAGDTVTVYGIIGQYNDTPQIKNGWITAHTPGAGGSTPPATQPTTPPATQPTTPPATEPAAPADGKVVISYPKENKFVTGAQYTYTSSKGTTKIELTLSENKADAIALEKITNSDGTVSFKAGSKYLFCDATDVKFVDSQSDNTKFVLEATTGGYFIKCAVATYQNKAQYLEVYSGYLTCYSKYDDSDASIYTFKLDNATGANGTITAPSTGDSGNSGNSDNSGNSGNTGNTEVTINGKLAASIDMKGTTTRTGFSSTQTVHAANGITYTNDKASSQTANIDMSGKTTGARAYKSSTVKIEYTGMVAIVFHLDDYNNGDYLKGFDNMTVAGATITRNGADVTITFASATNVFQSVELNSQVRIISIDVYTAN